jgi:hypothetical protein
MIRFVSVLLLFGWMQAMPAQAAGGTSERAYRLPGHGALLLQVPNGWSEELRQPPGELPPTAVFRASAGAPFTVLITPLWRASKLAPVFDSPERIYEMVQDTARQIEPEAVEKSLQVVPIGAGATGYYISATDASLVGRAPPPGEFLHLTQGAVKTGDLLCSFTILSNDPASPIIADALQMLRTASHRTKG